MRRGFGALALGLCLGACAGHNTLDAGLSRLVGKDIHDAIWRLGNPSDRQPAQDGKLYIWTDSHDVQVQSAQMSGAMVNMRPVYESVTTTVRQECTIRLATDSNDTIKSYQWSGDGCRLFYASAFKD